MTISPKPLIEFKGYSIRRLVVSRNIEELSKISDFKFKPDFSSTKDRRHAKISVHVESKTRINEKKEHGVIIDIDGYFSISEEIQNDDEKVGQFLIVNGTAILFPYIRSITSMVTSLDSKEALVLPTINTTELLKGENEE